MSVRERPILFSAPMVRAILAGTKTQTRRVIKPTQPREDGRWPAGCDPVPDCPYGRPGGRLWVRETWCDPESQREPIYRADMDTDDVREESEVRRIAAGIAAAYPALAWKPSIHMPRWASRITLELTDVRVQRLQEISEEDARAEGFSSEPLPGRVNGEPAALHVFDPIKWYALLWDAINAKRAPWASNPWVWALSFRRVA